MVLTRLLDVITEDEHWLEWSSSAHARADDDISASDTIELDVRQERFDTISVFRWLSSALLTNAVSGPRDGASRGIPVANGEDGWSQGNPLRAEV